MKKPSIAHRHNDTLPLTRRCHLAVHPAMPLTRWHPDFREPVDLTSRCIRPCYSIAGVPACVTKNGFDIQQHSTSIQSISVCNASSCYTSACSCGIKVASMSSGGKGKAKMRLKTIGSVMPLHPWHTSMRSAFRDAGSKRADLQRQTKRSLDINQRPVDLSSQCTPTRKQS